MVLIVSLILRSVLLIIFQIPDVLSICSPGALKMAAGAAPPAPGSSLITGLSEERGKESVAYESILVSLMAAFGHGIGKESNLALLINDTRK